MIKQMPVPLWLAVMLLSMSSRQALCQSDARDAVDPLVQLNLESRTFYAQARATVLAKSGPILLLHGDTLVLRDGEKRIAESLAESQYDELKTFAHVPLALDVMLIAAGNGAELSDALRGQLEGYRSALKRAVEEIEARELTTEQMERQQAIAASSLELIDEVLRLGSCSEPRRQTYVRQMTPLVMANTRDAGRATLKAMDRVVRRWQSELSDEQWRRLIVVVMGKQLPREGSLAVQYFARLLNVPGEGERIIYAESISDEAKALDLVGTHLLDAQVGIDFFDDRQRMKRDILSDAAREYLPELIPETLPPRK